MVYYMKRRQRIHDLHEFSQTRTQEHTVFIYDEIAEKIPLTFVFNLVGNPHLFYLTKVTLCTEDLMQ